MAAVILKNRTKADRRAWWNSLSPDEQFLYSRYRTEYRKDDKDRPSWQEWRAARINERLDREFAERIARD